MWQARTTMKSGYKTTELYTILAAIAAGLVAASGQLSQSETTKSVGIIVAGVAAVAYAILRTYAKASGSSADVVSELMKAAAPILASLANPPPPPPSSPYSAPEPTTPSETRGPDGQAS